jgi:hypothetical protein
MNLAQRVLTVKARIIIQLPLQARTHVVRYLDLYSKPRDVIVPGIEPG